MFNFMTPNPEVIYLRPPCVKSNFIIMVSWISKVVNPSRNNHNLLKDFGDINQSFLLRKVCLVLCEGGKERGSTGTGVGGSLRNEGRTGEDRGDY